MIQIFCLDTTLIIAVSSRKFFCICQIAQIQIFTLIFGIAFPRLQKSENEKTNTRTTTIDSKLDDEFKSKLRIELLPCKEKPKNCKTYE